MHTFLHFAVGFLASVSCVTAGGRFKRQTEALARLPVCIQNCLLSAYSAEGTSCSPTDFACLCKLKKFTEASVGCATSTCNSADQQVGAESGRKMCSDAGAPLDVPTQSTPTTPAVHAPPVPTPPSTPTTAPKKSCISLSTQNRNATLENGTTFNLTLKSSIKTNNSQPINASVWGEITIWQSEPPPAPATNETETSKAAKGEIGESYAAVKAPSNAAKREAASIAVFLGSFVVIFCL